MKKPENPNKKFELVIKDSELPSLSKEFAEVAVDGIMDDGVLRDLPLVGSLIGAVKFGNSINKYLSAKKIYKFLFELHHIPQVQRIKKIDEINDSKKYQSSVGEMIFELLERLESDGKPEIIGKLFAAVITEEIDYRTYLKCAHIIKSMFYYDLEELKNKYDGKYVIGPVNDGIFNSGLVDVNFAATFDQTKNHHPKKSDTTLTGLGDVIINIGMK
ncbi:hypothetical protein [Winogradskyella jejuensis]|uniref:Uncharacterized protein n=1 Tax=Winogradskyella jejuensis TaxID=1089305 RepID=A0A1M5VVR8_9FLAO|nr:hypothetical protein [Winogradskyella jejuensis]SHH79352.1 hypothetical protein SAMN05444148_2833 [Winogradskyella jejuensis]